MAPLPKKKLSRGRRNRRRVHDALSPVNLTPCPQCHEPRLTHRVCPSCGYYRGVEVVSTKTES